MPLILAFYCILGSDRILSDAPPLPAFRHKLYKQVINRMLHGPWRSRQRPPAGPGRMPGGTIDLGLAWGDREPPGLRCRAVGG